MGARASGRMLAMLAAALLSLLGCRAIAKGLFLDLLEDPEVVAAVKGRLTVEGPQFLRVLMTSGFYLTVDFLLAGQEPLQPQEQPFAQAVAVYVFGNTAGHDILARTHKEPYIWGEGMALYAAYYRSSEPGRANTAMDAMGYFNIFTLGQDGPDAMTFLLVTTNQEVMIQEGVFSIDSQIVPVGSAYGHRDFLELRRKSTLIKVASNDAAPASREDPDAILRDYLRSARGPLWPVMRVEYRLHRDAAGNLAYSLKDRYPFYVRIPIEIISGRPEVAAALDKLRRRVPERFLDADDALEVRLGYVRSMPISTHGTRDIMSEDEMVRVKRFRLLEDPPAGDLTTPPPPPRH